MSRHYPPFMLVTSFFIVQCYNFIVFFVTGSYDLFTLSIRWPVLTACVLSFSCRYAPSPGGYNAPCCLQLCILCTGIPVTPPFNQCAHACLTHTHTHTHTHSLYVATIMACSYYVFSISGCDYYTFDVTCMFIGVFLLILRSCSIVFLSLLTFVNLIHFLFLLLHY